MELFTNTEVAMALRDALKKLYADGAIESIKEEINNRILQAYEEGFDDGYVKALNDNNL